MTFVTDNAALVDIINKQTSKHKIVMILIRDMVLTTLKFNIFFTARHLPGKLNERADLISRFQIERFKANPLEWTNSQRQFPRTFSPGIGRSVERTSQF